MPKLKLPTVDELHELPRSAQVALAARCARRALVLYRHNQDGFRSVLHAIEVAEQFVAASETTRAANIAAQSVAEAAHAADDAISANAAYSAAHAVDAFSYTIYTNYAMIAATDAAAAAEGEALSGTAYVSMVTSICDDFSAVHVIVDREEGVESDVFDPRRLAHLWNSGEPMWYRDAYDEQQRWLSS